MDADIVILHQINATKTPERIGVPYGWVFKLSSAVLTAFDTSQL